MQVTPKRNNTIHYLPQEIKETKLTEVTYLPITREMLEQLFSNSAKKDKHRLVKKRRKYLIRQQVNVTSSAAFIYYKHNLLLKPIQLILCFIFGGHYITVY